MKKVFLGAFLGVLLLGFHAPQFTCVKGTVSCPITVDSITSSATPAPVSTDDLFAVTALAAGATFAAPSGTAVNGQRLTIRILDNGGAQTLAFTGGAAGYRASSSLALPTTTTASKTMYLFFEFNSAANRWDCLAYLDNF